ncbi:MAG: hypothetical protein FWE90_11650 [Defluviitaleaceae bacterium]|nr:hypothetical protein [Defluviitaleaceae bacterium]
MYLRIFYWGMGLFWILSSFFYSIIIFYISLNNYNNYNKKQKKQVVFISFFGISVSFIPLTFTIISLINNDYRNFFSNALITLGPIIITYAIVKGKNKLQAKKLFKEAIILIYHLVKMKIIKTNK